MIRLVEKYAPARLRQDCHSEFAKSSSTSWASGLSASKAGVVALTQAIADETKGTNIY